MTTPHDDDLTIDDLTIDDLEMCLEGLDYMEYNGYFEFLGDNAEMERRLAEARLKAVTRKIRRVVEAAPGSTHPINEGCATP